VKIYPALTTPAMPTLSEERERLARLNFELNLAVLRID
jgi:hypothetical protein